LINVAQCSLQDSSEWDKYVLGHRNSTPYHLMAWGKAVERAYGHRCHYLTARVQNKIVGLLPLVEMRIPLLHTQICSLPYCDVGGLLVDSSEVEQALTSTASELMLTAGATKVELRHSCTTDELLPAEGSKVRMLLPLQSSAKEQFKQFKSKLRSQVRKAEKNGVTFLEGNTEEHRRAFYHVMQVNMHQLGSPVHSRRWFEAVLDCYGNRARLGLVEYDGTVVGGAIILLNGLMVSVPWASTLPEYNHLSPNMLLYWGLLSIAAESGHKVFDFGRSTIGEGTYRFKKQWGAEPLALDWQVLNNGELNPVTWGETGGRRDQVADVWRRMPAALVNLMGPMLRRYISL